MADVPIVPNATVDILFEAIEVGERVHRRTDPGLPSIQGVRRLSA
jgi:hypothetical protein